MNLSKQLLESHKKENKTFKPESDVHESVISIDEKKRIKIDDVAKVKSQAKNLQDGLFSFIDGIVDSGMEDITPDISKSVYALSSLMTDFSGKLHDKMKTYVTGQVRKVGIKKGGNLDGNKILKFGGVKNATKAGDQSSHFYYSVELVVDGHWMNIQPTTRGTAWCLISKDEEPVTYGNGEDFTVADYKGKNIFFEPKELIKLVKDKSRFLNQ